MDEQIKTLEKRIAELDQKLFDSTGDSIERFQSLFDEVRALRLKLKKLKSQAANPRKTIFLTSNDI